MKFSDRTRDNLFILYENGDTRIVLNLHGPYKMLLPVLAMLAFGLWGLIPGLLLGFFLDLNVAGEDIIPEGAPAKPLHFGITYMMIAAELMKQDGVLSGFETKMIKNRVSEIYGHDFLQTYSTILNTLDRQVILIEGLCAQVKFYQNEEEKMILLRFLAKVAGSKSISNSQKDCFRYIVQQIGLQDINIDELLENHKHIPYVPVSTDAYQILGLSDDAPNSEIKKAYRKLAMETHPDLIENQDPGKVEVANDKFQELLHAYEKIKKERGLS